MSDNLIALAERKRPLTGGEHAMIRHMCEQNDFTWPVNSLEFMRTTGDKPDASPEELSKSNWYESPRAGFFVLDADNRGFLLVTPREETLVQIFCALVVKNRRREGTLRAMMAQVETDLPMGTNIWVEAHEDDVGAWLALGFKPTSTDTRPYQLKKVVE